MQAVSFIAGLAVFVKHDHYLLGVCIESEEMLLQAIKARKSIKYFACDSYQARTRYYVQLEKTVQS